MVDFNTGKSMKYASVKKANFIDNFRSVGNGDGPGVGFYKNSF